jgi:DNA-binding NtrC family response regulator
MKIRIRQAAREYASLAGYQVGLPPGWFCSVCGEHIMKKNPQYSILIVDDESAMRLFLCGVLEGEGYQTTPAQDGKEAGALLHKRKFDLVLSDVRMPGLDGLSLLRIIKEQSPETPVILLTAFGSVENAVEAMKAGATDYLAKPLKDPEELRLLVQRIFSEKRLRNQAEILQEETGRQFPCQTVVTRNSTMKRALDLARQVAATDTTVLIQGESGTGKELIARCIHEASPRAQEVFVAVNCASLAPTLLESELFGHEKGAFTGAVARHPGRFERAQGGTLFLDEIGEMDPSLQAKLLRVLQERQFERVGGDKLITVDVRIVAATNRDLQEAMRKKEFREDLYYRLSTFPIFLPPLRARIDDIPQLAEFLVAKAATRQGRNPKKLNPATLNALQKYAWPGNVRELENVMERALILAAAEEIIPADLPFPFEIPSSAPGTLAEIEKRAIRAALEDNQGHQRKTAEQLGISLRTLQYRLKEYGL